MWWASDIVVGWAQVSVAFALFLATSAYTIFSWKQIQEMRESRKLKIQPILKPSFDILAPMATKFTIENRGAGFAKEIEARWGFVGADHSHQWNCHTMNSGDSHWFMLSHPEDPDENADNIGVLERVAEEGWNQIWFEAKCLDANDQMHTFKETIDIQKNVVARFDDENNTPEMLNKDFEKKTWREIKKIRKSLKKLVKNFPDDSMQNYFSSHREPLVKTVVDGKRETTFAELKRLTGMDILALIGALDNLQSEQFLCYEGTISDMFQNPETVMIRFTNDEDGEGST